MKLSEAIDVVIENLERDEQYRQTWIANIAMSFYDEQLARRGVLPHEWDDVAEKAAERFLKLLCARRNKNVNTCGNKNVNTCGNENEN
jgi:hypothetical protein